MSKATKKKVEVGKPTAGEWDGSHPVMRTDKSNGYIPIFCHISGGGDPVIGYVWAHLESRDPEYRANALLIGAAPELLDAAKDALQFIESLIGLKAISGPSVEHRRKALKAIIAKATEA